MSTQELFSGGASSLFKTVAKRLRARGCAASKTAPPTDQPKTCARECWGESAGKELHARTTYYVFLAHIAAPINSDAIKTKANA